VILFAFHSQNGYAEAPQYYVLPTLPVLLVILPDECNIANGKYHHVIGILYISLYFV